MNAGRLCALSLRGCSDDAAIEGSVAVNKVEHMVDVGMASIEAEANEAARRWYAALDPKVGVGSRHHTVPRFLLARFSTNNRTWVRDLVSKGSRAANIGDLAITNFYTILAGDVSGERTFDGRFEQLLSTVEGNMASVLARIDVAPRQGVGADDRAHLAQFLSFQLIRGVRHRMEVELVAEYWAKTMLAKSQVDKSTAHRASVQAARQAGRTTSRGNGGWRTRSSGKRLPDDLLRQLSIRPHPNDHLSVIADAAPKLFEHFFCRPVTVVDMDEPLLLLGDEPVVVVTDRPPAHRPECSMTTEERTRAIRRSVKAGRGMRELVHIYPTRPSGIAFAEQIILPIGPSRALVLGGPNTDVLPYLSVSGREAREGAAALNALMMQQAYLWIAGRPDHPEIRTMDVPDRAPVFHICDGDSAASAAVSGLPSPFMPRRLRRT